MRPLSSDLVQGALCLRLLDLGRVAAPHAKDFRKVDVSLRGFAIVMPVLHAAIGLAVARAVGMSEGGAVIMATLAASASYIAARRRSVSRSQAPILASR